MLFLWNEHPHRFPPSLHRPFPRAQKYLGMQSIESIERNKYSSWWINLPCYQMLLMASRETAWLNCPTGSIFSFQVKSSTPQPQLLRSISTSYNQFTYGKLIYCLMSTSRFRCKKHLFWLFWRRTSGWRTERKRRGR